MSDDASSPTSAPSVGVGRRGILTEVEARALLDEQARSGLAFAEFARAHQLSPQRLSWWKAKFAGKHVDRSAHATRARSKPAAPRFVPIVTAPTSQTSRTAPTAAVVPAPRGVYELTLAGDITLRIPHDFHDESLARILRVLREAR